MEISLTPQVFFAATLIFFLRVGDMTLDTLRVLVVMRGRKAMAWVLGFFQATIFVLAISSVLSDLNNLLNVVGYAAGFATGNVVGMLIEERMAIGHIQISVISPRRGPGIAEYLREKGYAVTEIAGRGRDGTVSVLTVSVLRKNMEKVRRLVNEVDSDAFITAEDVRPIRRGFWRA